jgi:cytochrome P460
MTRRISFVILTLVVLAGYQLVSSQKTSSSQKTTRYRTAGFNGYELVDQTGNIRKPTDFRDRYQVLGTWMVLDPKGNEMHVTYASPGAVEYYRKNGRFDDGTVLVKEIFKTDHAQLTTGDAHWAAEPKV